MGLADAVIVLGDEPAEQRVEGSVPLFKISEISLADEIADWLCKDEEVGQQVAQQVFSEEVFAENMQKILEGLI